MMHAVIMAGGAGTRLWPLSRACRPKQLLRFLGGRSLLRESFERLRLFLDPGRIYVITGSRYLPLVAAELPEVPPQNLLGEPEGRDTANAVGLSAAIIHQRDPAAIMGIFTADHVVTPADEFAKAVRVAVETARSTAGALVTMGIAARRPETAFGYVKRGRQVADGVYEVEQFTEKPDADRARQYAESGEYYWNSGMFAWRTSAILEELRINLPVTYEGVREIAAAWDTANHDAVLGAVYPALQKISIDFAVMERARRVLVVEMNCHWADVGSWPQLAEVVGADEDGNVAAARRYVNLHSCGVTVVAEDEGHLIATVGLSDVIVVHSPDATLVCARHDAPALKELISRIRAEYGDEYL